jgi:hypothetical protein
MLDSNRASRPALVESLEFYLDYYNDYFYLITSMNNCWNMSSSTYRIVGKYGIRGPIIALHPHRILEKRRCRAKYLPGCKPPAHCRTKEQWDARISTLQIQTHSKVKTHRSICLIFQNEPFPSRSQARINLYPLYPTVQ